MALAHEGALPHAARADIGRDLQHQSDGEPGRLRVREKPGVLFRFPKVRRDGHDDRQQQHARNQTSPDTNLQITLPSSRPAPDGCQPLFQFADPNVPVSHRVSVILKLERQPVRMSLVRRPRPVGGGSDQLEVVLNQHAVEKHRHPAGFDLDRDG